MGWTWKQKSKVKDFRSISLKRPCWMLAKRKGKIKAYFVRMKSWLKDLIWNHQAIQHWVVSLVHRSSAFVPWRAVHSVDLQRAVLLALRLLIFRFKPKPSLLIVNQNDSQRCIWKQVHGSSYFVLLAKNKHRECNLPISDLNSIQIVLNPPKVDCSLMDVV